jgi:hypothetical protein
MHGPWVDVVGPGELSDSTKPLEGSMVYDLPLPIAERDESMNWAADFVCTMRVGHNGILRVKTLSREKVLDRYSFVQTS